MTTILSTAHAAGRKPLDVPSNPTNVETLSLGLSGLCAGAAWHNPDETRVTDWGLSDGGLGVQRGAYDMMRPWAAGEACQGGPGWSAEIGMQWGAHPAWDAGNEYAAAGYRVDLGDGVSLAVLAGGFFEGLNRKRPHSPIVVNFGGFYPFAAIELNGRF